MIPSTVLGQRGSCGPERLCSTRCPASLPDRASAWSLFCFRAFAQHPFHPKRADSVSCGAADPCYPARPPSPLQAKAARRKDASHRTVQPTFSTGTGDTARFLHPACFTPCGTARSTEVETSVDAASPASGLLSTLERGGTAKRGAPHRSGTALQRRSRPRAALEARPSDARVPTRPLSPTGRADSAVPPSRDTPLSAQGAFPRQVLPASLARRRTPATVPGALPPPGRLLAPRRSLLSLGRAGPAASSEAHHPGAGQVRRSCRLLQSPRFSSTTTDRPTTPRHAWSRLPGRCGQPCAGMTRCTTGQAVSEPGATEDANIPASASPRDRSLGSFAPTRSARTPPVTGSCLRRPESRAQVAGTNPHETAGERRKAPPARGLPPQPLREEGREPRTRGAFHRRAAVKPIP